ncbi:MAG TPA: UbiX family flavin prenyltransferase [Candidatus Acidoferrales bacterium]|nr:UbiX family flavin prenyltransferase [Candidatus Acidoferrales bacterium]
MKRYIVGITGASGSIYAVRALEALRSVPETSVHLVMSQQARTTLAIETAYTPSQVESLADHVHDPADLAAPISSGSFKTDGMLVIPCSIKSAAAIAYSLNDNLLVRAADVCLKERRRLVLVVRETPLHLGHLRTLTQLAEIGAVILPPIPGMYALPKSVDDIVNHTVGKALDALGVPNEMFARWRGTEKP